MMMEGLGTNHRARFRDGSGLAERVPAIDAWPRDYVTRRYETPNTACVGTSCGACSDFVRRRPDRDSSWPSARILPAAAIPVEPVAPYDVRGADRGAWDSLLSERGRSGDNDN